MTKIEAVEHKSFQPLRIILVLTLVGLVLLRINQPDSLIATLCGIPATLVMGIIVLWQAARDLRKRWHVYQHGIQTVARIKKIKTHGRSQHAVVEFLLPDNTQRTVEIRQDIKFDFGIFFPTIHQETDVTIRYDLTNTSEAYIFSSASIWLGPIIGLVAAIGLIASCFLL